MRWFIFLKKYNLVCFSHMKFKGPFGMEEKYGNFGGFKSYRKFSFGSLWNRGLNPMNSLEITMEWTLPCEFWRKTIMKFNLMFSFLYVLVIQCSSCVGSKPMF
jgi:hypothetical protein